MKISSATLDDVPVLNGILSALITLGDNTALDYLADEIFAQWFITGPTALFCHMARDEAGDVIGFQTLSTYGDLPKDWADIGTFARPDMGGRGIGRALMAASLDRLRRLGILHVNATIRADNVSGLGFYRKMGFEPYKTSPAIPLRDGRLVDRISHRLDL